MNSTEKPAFIICFIEGISLKYLNGLQDFTPLREPKLSFRPYGLIRWRSYLRS